VSDPEIAMTRTLPPVEFNDFRKTKIGYQVRNVRRDDDRGSGAPGPQIVVHDRAQRRAMQMIEMSVRNQNEIDGRKIRDTEAGTTKALQYKQPPREVGINDDALSTNLHEEAGMSDKGDTEFTVGGETRFVSLT